MKKKKLLTILLLAIISIILIISIIGVSYYNKVYNEYLTNRNDHIKTLNYYKYLINKKAYPQIFIKAPVSVNSKEDIKDQAIYSATIIYDINGKEIGKFSKEDRNIVGLNDVSPHFIKALINSEDRQFYEHNGINHFAIANALMQNLFAGRIVRGGSTLTQQLAKLLFTTSERNLHRKVYEIIITKNLIEKYYDKNDILEMYVNYIYFGHNVNGVEEASKFYFKKAAKNLNIIEAALLVGIIPNPSLFSPFKNIKYSKKKHLNVLKSMHKQNLIDSSYPKLYEEFWDTNNFKKIYSTKKYNESLNKAPYVVEEVKRQLIRTLVQKNIFDDENQAFDFLHTKGLRIYTYIDMDLQLKARNIIRKRLTLIRKNLLKKKKFKYYDKSKIQAALIAINPKTGGIKAFVGGEKFSVSNQYNRAFQAMRQPGSAFKPIFYAAALDDRLITPYSLVLDKYEPISLKHNKVWKVKNYNDQYLNKKISLTQAIKISSNQVAARIASDIGIKSVRNFIQKALDLSFEESINRYKDDQYSIILGSVEMSLIELATIYSTFANKGLFVKPKLIKSINDLTGKSIIIKNEQLNPFKKTVISKEAAYLISKILQQVLDPGGTGYYAKKSANINFDIAGKSGTSQDSRDLWFAGFTPELSAAVWVGHDDSKPLSGTGGTIAGPIFTRFMKLASLYYTSSSFSFDNSYNFETQDVCIDSGLKAVKGKCVNIKYNAKFMSNTKPLTDCDLPHDENPFNQLLGIPANTSSSTNLSPLEQN